MYALALSFPDDLEENDPDKAGSDDDTLEVADPFDDLFSDHDNDDIKDDEEEVDYDRYDDVDEL